MSDNNTNTASTWESRYGDIVWAKFQSFPWWPSFILDPHKVLKRDNCKGYAIANIGKTYTVYFYGDETLGFASPSNIKPFTPENTAKFKNQKIPKAYKDLFPTAISIAEDEMELAKEDRIAWYTEEENVVEEQEEELEDEDYSEEDDKEGGKQEENEEPVKSPIKRKREDFPSLTSGTTSKRLKKNSSKKKIESDDEVDDEDILDQADEDEYSEDNVEEDEEHISSEFDNSDDEGKKKTKKVLGKERRLSKLSEKGTASEKKKVSKPKKEKSLKRATSDNKAKSLFEEESREDRLTRLFEILKLTTTVATLDEARALKTLEKLKGMNLSFDELKSSGVGKFITTLKSHVSGGICDAASKLLQLWKSTMSGGNNSVRISTGEKVELSSDKATTPKVEVVIKLEDIVSSEVKEDVERWRGLRLLHSVIADAELSVRFESAIFEVFSVKNVYFECVNRFFNLLRSLPSSEVKPFLLQSFGTPVTTAEQDETNAPVNPVTKQMTNFILQQFSYIAVAN